MHFTPLQVVFAAPTMLLLSCTYPVMQVVFAARDASGEEELYYAVAEDGSLMFTNSLASLPPETAGHAWQPLPPGHYMAGKDAVLIQVGGGVGVTVE